MHRGEERRPDFLLEGEEVEVEEENLKASSRAICLESAARPVSRSYYESSVLEGSPIQ